jgi:hypothetical protein
MAGNSRETGVVEPEFYKEVTCSTLQTSDFYLVLLEISLSNDASRLIILTLAAASLLHEVG